MAELAQNLSQAAHGMADYKYVVLYEKFCTQCGEAGHTEDQCGKYKTTKKLPQPEVSVLRRVGLRGVLCCRLHHHTHPVWRCFHRGVDPITALAPLLTV